MTDWTARVRELASIAGECHERSATSAVWCAHCLTTALVAAYAEGQAAAQEAEADVWRRAVAAVCPAIPPGHEDVVACVQARVATLEAALRKYGMHVDRCHALCRYSATALNYCQAEPQGACSCGLDAALAAPPTEAKP